MVSNGPNSLIACMIDASLCNMVTPAHCYTVVYVPVLTDRAQCLVWKAGM